MAQTQKEREAGLFQTIRSEGHTIVFNALVELLTMRKDRYCVALLDVENARIAGRGQECRDLLSSLLTDKQIPVDFE